MVKVAHISDIHFRPLDRHEEYTTVFSKIFHDLKHIHKPDLIFVGGDIYHMKTQAISPEVIERMAWWFRSLSEICPVISILGNHDGNITNLERADIISPIVNFLNSSATSDKRSYIKLCKNSEEFVYNNIRFGVFSLFDKDGWSSVSETKNNPNNLFSVACFHGCVNDAVADNGMKLEGEVDLSLFKNFDFVFLGDIHKRQAWRHHGNKTGTETAWYPGSTIQQNYGEEIEKGYLIWNIENSSKFSVDFIPVKNDHAFLTFPYDGNVDDTLNKIKEVSSSLGVKSPRVRIESNLQIPPQEWKELSSRCRSELSITELVAKLDKQIIDDEMEVSSSRVSKSNLHELETQKFLLRKYMSSTDRNLSQEEWDFADEVLKRNLDKINLQAGSINRKRWSIRNLKFSNLYGYGEDNEIAFNKLSGLVGIFGPNRTGKSSIVGSILYSLFNYTDRGSVSNWHIVNVRKTSAMSVVDIEIDSRFYRIERTIEKKPSNPKAQYPSLSSLSVHEITEDGTIIKNMKGDKKTDSEQIVANLIGSAEDFILSSISTQGDINRFIQEGATKRKLAVSKFLELDIFDELLASIKSESDDIRARYKIIKDIDYAAEILKESEKITKFEAEIREHQNQIDFLLPLIESLQRKIMELEINGKVSSVDIEVQKHKITSYEAQISKHNDEIEDLKEKIASLDEQLSRITEKKELLDIKQIEESLSVFNKLSLDFSKVENSLALKDQEFQSNKQATTILSSVPCGDKFPTCPFLKGALASKAKLPILEGEILSLKENVKEYQEAIDEFVNLNLSQKKEQYNKLIASESIKSQERRTHRGRLDTLYKHLAALKNKLDNEKQSLLEISKREMSKDVASQYDEYKTDLDQNISKCNQSKHLLNEVNKQYAVSNSNIQRLRKESDEADIIFSKWKIYDMLATAFSQKGIPVFVLKSQLPNINAEIARLLTGISNFDIKFELDPNIQALDVFIDYGDSRRIIEMASGMEKTMASLVIRAALYNISNISKPDIFVIDEGFGTLDDAGRESCVKLLQNLENEFKSIFVITHVDEFKQIVSHLVEIKRSQNKDSHINVT